MVKIYDFQEIYFPLSNTYSNHFKKYNLMQYSFGESIIEDKF